MTPYSHSLLLDKTFASYNWLSSCHDGKVGPIELALWVQTGFGQFLIHFWLVYTMLVKRNATLIHEFFVASLEEVDQL